MQQAERESWGRWAAAFGAGLLLRAGFLAVHARFVGDTLVYGDLARNLLTHGVYGLTENGHVRATLIRLPGYPLFLAACFWIFGMGRYLPVLWVQVVLDLLGCGLLGLLARRVFHARVGLLCVWLAALCPFTANYVAAALTETLSIFCVVMGFWGLTGWLSTLRRGASGAGYASVVGLALCGAVLLRPDGILLSGAVLPAMGWVAWRRVYAQSDPQTANGARGYGADGTPMLQRRAWVGVGLAVGLLALCLGAWTARNWRVYHVVQPLAPKYANDPGEPAPLGFARWYRTWGIGLGDTARVYWVYDGEVEQLRDLPPWAFDSAAQRAQTAALYARYNAETSSTPATEAAFAQLAAARVRAHPVRFYVLLPLARLADMWLRPRTELLPRMPLDWWRFRARPRAALFGWAYGALNLALLGAASAGLWRWRRLGWQRYGVLAAAMVGFVLLRSALLMTIDNSEPRYVLECYPVVLLLAAVAVDGWWLGRGTITSTTRV